MTEAVGSAFAGPTRTFTGASLPRERSSADKSYLGDGLPAVNSKTIDLVECNAGGHRTGATRGKMLPMPKIKKWHPVMMTR